MCCPINVFAQGVAIVTQGVAMGMYYFAQGVAIVAQGVAVVTQGVAIGLYSFALSGREWYRRLIPGALPWAGRLLPFQGRRIIAITEQNLHPERGSHIIAQRQHLGITNDIKQERPVRAK